MKKGQYYGVVDLLLSTSSSQAIIVFSSSLKSKEHLLLFIWSCWKAVWKTPQHFSTVLIPHKSGNRYKCLFFSSQGQWTLCSGWKHSYLIKASKSSSQCSKVCVAQAGPAHGCTLECSISWSILEVEEKNANHTVIPRNMSKAPHTAHMTITWRNDKIDSWLVGLSAGLSLFLFNYGQNNLFKLNF